jgi:hypothetical protein
MLEYYYPIILKAAMNYGYYNDQGVQIGLQSPPMVAATSISSRPVLMPMQGTHGYNNVASSNNMVQQGQERASQNLSHRVIQDNGINGGSVGGIDEGAVFQRKSEAIGTSLQRLAALNLVQEENLTINRMEDWDADVSQMFSPSLQSSCFYTKIKITFVISGYVLSFCSCSCSYSFLFLFFYSPIDLA